MDDDDDFDKVLDTLVLRIEDVVRRLDKLDETVNVNFDDVIKASKAGGKEGAQWYKVRIDNIYESIESLSSAIGAVTSVNPNEVIRAAEAGGKAGAQWYDNAAQSFSDIANDLKSQTEKIAETTHAVAFNNKKFRWWQIGAVSLVGVILLLASFIGGAVFIKYGVALGTSTGCEVLGGAISEEPDGKRACWKWIDEEAKVSK